MKNYCGAAVERAMKIQEVLLQAMAKKITWWQAAEIIGISDRSMRRWRERYERHGYDGLFDRRRGKPSPMRVPLQLAERVLALYREKYFDLNVRHFHEKLQAEHGIQLSYTWVKRALQGAGLVKRERKRGVHRKRRPRRPLPGMLLHIDGSKHGWFQDDRWYDLLAVMDDANSEIYYAQLVEEESTRTVMAALRQVIERKGRFCALYSDRASHFFLTPRAGGPVDAGRLTQVGRALKELGIQMIPAYSPQARGRSERNFGTWQGRLPQELRLAGIRTVEEANRFLRERYVRAFNRRFMVPAAQAGHAFVALAGQDMDRIFSVQQERVVAKDNTVQIGERVWQIERTRWRGTLAGCRVVISEHLDGQVTIYYGPQVVGRYTAEGKTLALIPTQHKKRCGNDAPWKAWKTPKAEFPTLSPALGNPARNAGFPHSHSADGGV
ncbi:MAG: ISNCY family transposase [Terriglobia bacterium]